MTKYNSISPINYLLYLILLISAGCAEQTTTHVVINQVPPPIESASISRPITFAPAKPNSTNLLENVKLPIIQHKTVWDRLFSLYALPEIENKRIDKEIQRYLNHPKYLAKIQKRAEPYLYFILDEIEAKQIPGELALLPVVESAFKPMAISQSRASGLWQFMPATGRLFGLKQNGWYDGRNDIYKSTQAAATYLKELSNLYDNDWLMALAAYNAGKGNIAKAIRRNKKRNKATDYWSLPLTKETTNYVPRLLAIAKIFANSEKYNIPLQQIPNKPYFSVVNIDSQIDLAIAAKMADTPLDVFFTLNPAYKRWCTDPKGPYHLLIHSDKTKIFKEKLAKTEKKDRMKWIRHSIKSGENLGLLARKYKTTVTAIRQSNHLANNTIRAGKVLLIPYTLVKTDAAAATKANRRLYIVKRGDTFWDIARKFDVRSKDIAHWNNLSLKKALQPGQRLIIKKG